MYPKPEIIPEKSPTQSGPAALVKTPLGAPMATPPASVAFKMSSISNLSRKREVIMKVPKQLPVNAMIVFAMMVLF